MVASLKPLPDHNLGEQLFNEISTLHGRIGRAADAVCWLALRPSDYETAALARKYLHLGAVLMELMQTRGRS